MATADVVSDMHGDGLCQERAWLALPILVRQAETRSTITYKALAAEIGMPHHRPLNRVLGCIGVTLSTPKIYREIGAKIPPIQCLVVNKRTGLPGFGFDGFIRQLKSPDISSAKREYIIAEAHNKVYDFRQWRDVLRVFGMMPRFTIIDKAGKSGRYNGTGEGPEHKKLKKYVANNPEQFGLPASARPGKMEHVLSSGDALDVFFEYGKNRHTGIEVKSHISNDRDIVRGLFQCVKYKAVMEAMQKTKCKRGEVRAFLVMGDKLTGEPREISNILGIDVYDNISIG